MSGKALFMQYKYPISANNQLATVCWCLLELGLAAPESLKSTCNNVVRSSG